LLYDTVTGKRRTFYIVRDPLVYKCEIIMREWKTLNSYAWGRGNPLPGRGKDCVGIQEAKYEESWPNTASAWASWRRFDIPVDRYD
jgi:hypothetical protein